MTAYVYDEDYQPRTVPMPSGITVAGLWVIFVSLIFLQRFTIGGVQVAFAISCAVLLVLVMVRAIIIDTTFLIFFFIATAFASLSIFWWPPNASVISFLYLIAIYALYMFRFRERDATFALAQDIFLKCMVVAAIMGILQFALQFVLGVELVFPLEMVPESFLAENYNVIIPLTYGSPIMKSNGVVFLEPSFFSQFLAIAVIIEVLNRQRLARCLLYLFALMLSYSGTGLTTVLLFAPFVLARRVNVAIILGCVATVVLVVLSMSVLDFDTMFGRVEEFSSTESSGFARFISPFYLMRDFLIPSPDNFLFGMGPGTIINALDESSQYGYLAHDPTWIKLIFEYGLVGGLAMISYVVAAMYTGSRDKLLSSVLLMIWLILGGYLLNGLMNVLFISLGALHAIPALRASEPPLRPRRARMATRGDRRHGLQVDPFPTHGR